MRIALLAIPLLAFILACGDSSTTDNDEHVRIEYVDDPPDLLAAARPPIN